MPIYEYKCGFCGDKIERKLPYDALPPTCCDTEMRKLISRPGYFAFRGSGFYATEYGSQSHNLNKKDQTHRALKECKEQGIRPSKPEVTNSNRLKAAV